MHDKELVLAEGEKEVEVTVGEESDPLAIATGEKPPFDVSIKTWSEDSDFAEDNEEIHLTLAKDKKAYQRGIARIQIGESVAHVSIDVLLSCFYSVYETDNPYKEYNPNKPIIKAFGLYKEEAVEATKDTPAGFRRELRSMTLEESELLRLSAAEEGLKPVDLLISIEEVKER